MPYALGEPTVQQYVDANGDPLVNGTIEFFIWNTSTPTPIYSDSSGTSAGTSITLNSLGAPENSGTPIALFFNTFVVYKIVRKDAAGAAIAPTIGPYYGSGAGAGVVGTIEAIDVNATDSLYLYTGTSDNQMVNVGGYYAPGDLGGGTFYWDIASTASDDAALVILPTGHVGAGRWVRVYDHPLSVRWYGAKGDGTTDDTAAINAAIAELKTRMVDNTYPELDYVGSSLLIPDGIYLVSTINFTGFRVARNVHIQAKGAVFLASTVGKVVVDCTGSRWLWFDGLVVYSSLAVTAKSGFQLGNEGAETCGNNKFYSVQCLGYYSLAPFTNFGSETTQYYSCRFSNSSGTAATYAFYGDGQAVQAYTSDYVTVTRSIGTAVSFTNNHFYSCQFRHLGAGGSVWLSKTTGWEFDSGCYLLCYTGAVCTLYSTTASRQTGLVLGGLWETQTVVSPFAGLEYGVEFVGDSTATAMDMLQIRTILPHVSTALLKNSTGSTVRLSNADITFNAFKSDEAAALFVESGSLITFHGTLNSREDTALGLDGLAQFYGNLYCGNVENVTFPSDAKYNLLDEAGNTYTMGTVIDSATVGAEKTHAEFYMEDAETGGTQRTGKIYSGDVAPTITATNGSLYIRVGGTGQLYVYNGGWTLLS